MNDRYTALIGTALREKNQIVRQKLLTFLWTLIETGMEYFLKNYYTKHQLSLVIRKSCPEVFYKINVPKILMPESLIQ